VSVWVQFPFLLQLLWGFGLNPLVGDALSKKANSSLIMVSKATFLGTWGDEAELDAVVARA